MAPWFAPRRFGFQRAVWACVLGPGLGCAQPFLAGLSGCIFFFAFLFFLFFFFLSRALWSLSFHPPPFFFFRLGWWLSLFFFFSVSLSSVGRCSWLGVADFGWVVPLCLFGGPVFGAFWGGRVWPPLVVLAGVFFFHSPFSRWAAVPGLVLPVLGGWPPCASLGVPSTVLSGGGGVWPPPVGLAAVGCFRAVSPSPLPFFWGGGGGACLFLPLPSLGWRTHWPAFSVVFRAAVFSCVLFGRVPAPWVGWAMYTLGSVPLLAGLGPGSAGPAAAPGGCLWFWVRGLGLFVSFPLCGAGCNLLSGPPPLSPGAL